MKPKLKPPGTTRLKLKCDVLLSTSAFKLILCRCTQVSTPMPPLMWVDVASVRRCSLTLSNHVESACSQAREAEI